MADPKIKIKRSSVEGKIPTPDQVPLGEIALNTYDGYLYASKNVGIGTTIIAINPFRVGTGTDSYNAYFTAGNVGIGTDNPTEKLDVRGNIVSSGNLLPLTDNTGVVGNASYTWNNGQFTNLTVDSTLTVTSTLNVRAAIDLADSDVLRFGTGDDWEFFHNGTHNYMDLNNGNLIIRDNTTTRFTFERSSGNVGISSNTPTSKLDVIGDAKVSGVVTATTFVGNLTGTATTATNLADAANITTGTINSARLSGSYNIDITGNASSATYAASAGIATYSTSSGIATNATYATTAGVATALQNSRTFEITGDIVASAISFDGSGNVSLAATIQPNSVALGSDTTGDYVSTITGTSNQITVTSGTGEGSTPTLSIPNQFTVPQDITVTRDLQVDRNLNVNGNITIGGTSATLFTTEFKVYDPDIVLGFRTDGSGNDVSTDNTANHGGIAIASTEGTPLISLYDVGVGETNPATYKKIMWFKSGTFSGLGTDAWISNYAIGIGSTQVPNGVRLAAGGMQVTDSTISSPQLNVSGVSTFQGNVNLGDNDRLRLGDGNDLQIYHDGSENYIDDAGVGSLLIRTLGNNNITLQNSTGAMLTASGGTGRVELYYDNSKKFETTGAGATVFGTLQTQQLNVSGVSTFQGNVYLGDNDKIVLGDGGDLEIFHNSANNNSIIQESGSGNLVISGTNIAFRNGALSEDYALFTQDGSVELYYDNSKKFETTGAGATVFGTLQSQQLNVSGVTTASSFVKSGGTSSEFLKADGSVDSSTYLTTTGSGTNLTGIVTSIVAGTNITISGSTGQVTINSTASGGGGSAAALDILEVMMFA